MVGDRVADVLIREGGEFAHGYTYSGHPAAAALALANLKILREEKIIERVRDELAPYFATRWRQLADHPLVGEARSLGLLGACQPNHPDVLSRSGARSGHARGTCRSKTAL